MKFLKLFSVIALSAATMSAFAAINAQAKISVKADVSKYGDNIMIYQDDASSQLVGDIYQEDDAAVNLYAEINSVKYSSVKQASLTNLVVKMVANSYETAYTLTLSECSGDIMLVCGSDTITSTKNNPYAFTAEKEGTITFTVNPAVVYPYTHTVAKGNWGTICFPEAITDTVGATIYEFAGKNDTQVAADPVSLPLEKGKAYLFLATADAQGFNYTEATQATAPVDNNGLVGTFSTIKVSEGEPYVIKQTSLVPAMPANVPANRAYVPVLGDIPPLTGAPARAGRKIFNIVGTATGVEELEAAPAMNGKVMMNGKLVIIRDGKMFNAQGAAL